MLNALVAVATSKPVAATMSALPKKVAALFVLVSLYASGAVAGACDPMASQNDNAKALRVKLEIPEAEKIVAQVLAKDSGDFRANYTAALIALDKGRKNRNTWISAIKQLEAVVPLLAKQDEACAKEKNYYSIYNTIGVEYYGLDDLQTAKKYFDLAYTNREKLNADTGSKLLDNLGLVAYRQGNYVCAAAYFQRAEAAGAKHGAYHLGLAKKVLASTKDSRSCPVAN